MNIEKIIKEIQSSDVGKNFIKIMKERSFLLKDTNVSSRVYNSWKNAELLDSPLEDSRKWVKLNFIEYIWLAIVRDLRVFGISFEVIKKIKAEVLSSPSLIVKEVIDEKKINKMLIEMISVKESCSKVEAEKILGDIKKESNSETNVQLIEKFFGRSPSLIETYLCLKAVCNYDSSLFIFLKNIKSDPETAIKELEDTSELNWFLYCQVNEGRPNDDKLKEFLFSKPRLELPLSNYIDFFTFNHLEKSKKLGWISEEEAKLLHHVREGNAEQITITLKNKKVERIAVTKNESKNIEAKLIKGFGKNEFADVRYKIVNGKVDHFSITKKYKLNAKK